MRNRLNNIFIFACPILMVGVVLGYLHLFEIVLVTVMCLFTLNRREAAIAVSLIFPSSFGILFQAYSIAVPGALAALLLTVILLNKDCSTLFVNKARSMRYIIITLLIFVAFYFIGGRSFNATNKITTLFITSIYSLFALYSLASYKDINMQHFAPLYFLYGLISMCIGFDLYGYSALDGLFDFTSFRNSWAINMYSELPYVNYHVVGMSGVLTATFVLSSKNKLKFPFDYILLLSCFWIILVSGARQSIVAFFIVIIMWVIMQPNKHRIRNIVVTCLIVIMGIFFLQSLDVQTIQQVFDDNASVDDRMNRNFDYALNVISREPIFGIGFGNYLNPTSNEIYPHNIVLEILCEAGITGLMIIITILSMYLRNNNKTSITNILPNGSYALLVITPYTIRAMISGDIGLNIIIFIMFYILFEKRTSIIKAPK